MPRGLFGARRLACLGFALALPSECAIAISLFIRCASERSKKCGASAASERTRFTIAFVCLFMGLSVHAKVLVDETGGRAFARPSGMCPEDALAAAVERACVRLVVLLGRHRPDHEGGDVDGDEYKCEHDETPEKQLDESPLRPHGRGGCRRSGLLAIHVAVLLSTVVFGVASHSQAFLKHRVLV